MNMAKRFVSLFMAVVLLIGPVTVNSYATNPASNVMSQEEWNGYWDTVKNDKALVSLTPGSDPSELNFTWHSSYMELCPCVRISKSADMRDYTEFKGCISIGDKNSRVNKTTVTGLEENTEYYYIYGTAGNFSEPALYRTHSAETFKAVYVGDIQCGTEDATGTVVKGNAYVWQKALGTALDNNPDISFVLSAGDQTNSGDVASEWTGTLAPKALRSIPIATCIGNHDNKGHTYKDFVNNPNEYKGLFSTIYGGDYWFRYGDVLFLIYNSSNVNFIDHFNFTKQAVLANGDATWRIAMLHHDIYGTGGHTQSNDNKLLQSEFGSIFDKFEVDVALSGHEHIYGRSFQMLNNQVVNNVNFQNGSAVDPKGTLYLTSNSAGGKGRIPETPYNFFWLDYTFPTESVIYSTLEFSKTEFKMKAFSVDTGKLVDEYSIVKTEPGYSSVNTADTVWKSDMMERVLGKYYVLIKALSSILNLFGKIN